MESGLAAAKARLATQPVSRILNGEPVYLNAELALTGIEQINEKLL